MAKFDRFFEASNYNHEKRGAQHHAFLFQAKIILSLFIETKPDFLSFCQLLGTIRHHCAQTYRGKGRVMTLFRGSKRAEIAHILTGICLVAVVISGAVMGTANTGFHIPHPIDKAAHFIGFALFTFLFGRFFHAYLVAAILVLIAGTGVEVIQAFMPNRLFSLADIAANCSGAVFVLIIRWLLDGAGVSLAYFLPKRFERTYHAQGVTAH